MSTTETTQEIKACDAIETAMLHILMAVRDKGEAMDPWYAMAHVLQMFAGQHGESMEWALGVLEGIMLEEQEAEEEDRP